MPSYHKLKKNHIFDTTHLKILPLSNREHNLDLSVIMPMTTRGQVNKNLTTVAKRIIQARKKEAAVVLMMGAHVIRAGVQRYLIDMMKRGRITCLSMNGAGIIHDFELSLIGKTTENVARYITDGRFGLWQETGLINDIVNRAAKRDMGLGEAVGKEILEGDFPHKDISLFAAGYRLGIPVTVHVGIGYDIVYEHPNCDGAAWGKTSYTDFLRFAGAMESLKNGVVMNFGSAVMAPEIFLKALTMVRNIAKQEERKIDNFTTLVCDIKPLPAAFHAEAERENPDYYFRPWKTMLVRSLAGSGKGYYVQGEHGRTIPELWTAITNLESSARE
ncbi:MAG: hypothetical protein HN416_18095 [Nitrospina sp.]|nr:hypothetical protein [Nitrospina sp.]